MTPSPRSPLARATLALLLALALGGCANLSAIAEFGRLSSDGVLYRRLTDEYVGSLHTMQDLTLKRQQQERDNLVPALAKRQALAPAALLMQQAVAEYMGALAALAGDELVVLDDQVDDLAGAATKAELLGEQRAKTVASIGKLLTEAALNGYRQRQLATLIEAGNGPLQALIADLTSVMERYAEQIQIEQDQFNFHYRTLGAMATPGERAAAELIWAQQRSGARQFAPRRQAIASYIATIGKIGQAHQALYDNRSRIADREVHAQLKHYIKRIQAVRAD